MALAATSDQHTASKRVPLFSLIVEVGDEPSSEIEGQNDAVVVAQPQRDVHAILVNS